MSYVPPTAKDTVREMEWTSRPRKLSITIMVTEIKLTWQKVPELLFTY